MSDLRPKGVTITIDGTERNLLFTLNVIDEIQDHYDMAMTEVWDKLTDKREAEKTIRYLLCTLLNDEAEREKRNGRELKNYTEKEVGWIISVDDVDEILSALLKAYGVSLPEPDEDEHPNQKSGQMKK
jgi:hypothetical protein|nr:MAG TPA: tail tube protein [Caudoviricetes sp.]